MKITRLLRLLLVFIWAGLVPQTVAEPAAGVDASSAGGEPAAIQAASYNDIYSLVMRMSDAWNAHNLEEFLQVFWNSPDLVVIIEGEQIRGWAELNAAYHRGYPDPSTMGSGIIDKIQIQTVTSDVALVVDWWTIVFSDRKVSGTSTFVVRKLSDGWRVVAGHTTIQPA